MAPWKSPVDDQGTTIAQSPIHKRSPDVLGTHTHASSGFYMRVDVYCAQQVFSCVCLEVHFPAS